MITDVSIKNFKCFKQLELHELRKITLIGGRNNVGKTALLEALFLFADRIHPDMVFKQYGWRGVETVTTTPESMWGPIFTNFDMTQEILISVVIDGQKESATFKYNPNFLLQSYPIPGTQTGVQEVRTDQPVTLFSLDIKYTNGIGKKTTSHLVVSPQGQPGLQQDSPDIKSRQVIILPAKKHISSKENCDRFSKLAEVNKEKLVIKFLQLIEPRVSNAKILTDGPNRFVAAQVGGGKVFPVAFMGEGMAHVLSIVCAIAEREGGIVFIDEIENGIHYSAIGKLWEAIGAAAEDYKCQIIATTHSYECLEAAHKGLVKWAEDFRYIRLDRSEDTITGKVSDYDMLSAALANNLEVR